MAVMIEIVLIKAFTVRGEWLSTDFLRNYLVKNGFALQCPFTEAVCPSFPQDRRDLGKTGRFPLMWWSLKTRTVSSALALL